jgi:hypothetical protein
LTEERFLELLDWWIEEGDPEEIAAYLAHRMIFDSKWMHIVELIASCNSKSRSSGKRG